jgi:phosphoenolpyruvate phosphomutase
MCKEDENIKALILNSGIGSRMGGLTESAPKCLTELFGGETILSRQLRLLAEAGVSDIVITTGYCDDALRDYARRYAHGAELTFVRNPEYAATNYIYSIWLAREYLDDDILLLHGDLVFEPRVLSGVLSNERSCVVQSGLPLPGKDFKAQLTGGRVKRVGVDVWESAVACQPLYKLNRFDWQIWLGSIEQFVAAGKVKVYAEDAFNEISEKSALYAYDIGGALCREIDTPEDLAAVNEILREG